MKLKEIVLTAFMAVSPLKGGDYISKNDMHKYQFGIVDLNDNKKTDVGDAFFINDKWVMRRNWTGKTYYTPRVSYIHHFYKYEERIDKDGMLKIDFELSEYSDGIWYDFNADGHIDHVTKENKDNSEFLNMLFDGHIEEKEPTKIERK